MKGTVVAADEVVADAGVAVVVQDRNVIRAAPSATRAGSNLSDFSRIFIGITRCRARLLRLT